MPEGTGNGNGNATGRAPHERPAMPQEEAALSPPYRFRRQRRPGIEADMELRPRYLAPHYRGSGKLTGKVALITGGDSGIGRSVAVPYAREGADVAIGYLPEEQRDADETRAAVEKEGGSCLLLPGDLCDPAFCAEAVERTVAELGGLNVLVHNAAYLNSRNEPADDRRGLRPRLQDEHVRLLPPGHGVPAAPLPR
ncbi:SDR family NAD(P)-dependent oxidoreductase [Streptomyces sp. ISL-12]|uniref:SDR family NAD(P)-dependent oxidoreductase n=1 Tax=Streptomyces sp. ISL-12 TaxID=2819177 RepID=UPI0020350459|nr:SDR family NAD(P)-dependent oxidoreductase [Streptomyces sp. ISL-12]